MSIDVSLENEAATGNLEQAGEQDTAVGIPLHYAKKHGVITKGMEEGGAITLLCRPGVSLQTILEARRHLGGRQVQVVNCSAEEFQEALTNALHDASSQTIGRADQDQGLDLAQVAQELAEPADLLESDDDAPIIRLLNAVFTEAVKSRASDIHIEPYEKRLLVRMRVDGLLRELISPSPMLAPLIVSRIKVMSKLDIAEKRLPQDGRISLQIAGRPIDVRVSTLPTGRGERVVLRLLDKKAGRIDLPSLGMPDEIREGLEKLISRPNGILLVTGPTGSGKTTTLYALLQKLHQVESNIMTVEDPIEYELAGVSQTQINTRVDLTFAKGLRAILRQDPDIVMVGEIRDLETVQIAVQASLTGHLVLSTLHTNTAIGAITRLRDMGIEPYLLSSSLIGVLAQRLVRRLCEECKVKIPLGLEAKEAFASQRRRGRKGEPEGTFYGPNGCDACSQTGFTGRTGIYEFIPMEKELRQAIHDQKGELALLNLARKRRQSILANGLDLLAAGETTWEEVARVTREE